MEMTFFWEWASSYRFIQVYKNIFRVCAQWCSSQRTVGADLMT